MWFFGLIVVLLIGAVAVVASGRWGAMSTAYDDRPDMTVPARQALTSNDIESARFGVGLRGYRMDEVDTLLERVAKEVAERDRRIADLERAVAPIVDAPEGAGFTSGGGYDPAEFDDTGVQQPILVGGNFPEPATPTVEPGTDPVTTEQPAVHQPTTSQPSAQQATAGQPSAEQLTAGQPSAQQAAAEQAAAGQPPAQQSALEQPGTAPARTAAEAAAAEDDELDTREIPRTSHAAAADEYERLQAEARALLEAQSQPTTPRRTPAPPNTPPAPQHPEARAQQPEAAAPQPPEAYTSAPSDYERQPAPEEQRADQGGYQQQAGQGQQQEGWQFWPPAEEQGGPVWPQAAGNGQAGDQEDGGSQGGHGGASDEGAYQRPN
jgi:DivIVA domain-containing protein